MQPLQVCIGPIIRIGRESWCLPYAGFFLMQNAYLIGSGASIRNGWEIRCLPYAGFFFVMIVICFKDIPNSKQLENVMIDSKVMAV